MEVQILSSSEHSVPNLSLHQISMIQLDSRYDDGRKQGSSFRNHSNVESNQMNKLPTRKFYSCCISIISQHHKSLQIQLGSPSSECLVCQKNQKYRHTI